METSVPPSKPRSQYRKLDAAHSCSNRIVTLLRTAMFAASGERKHRNRLASEKSTRANTNTRAHSSYSQGAPPYCRSTSSTESIPSTKSTSWRREFRLQPTLLPLLLLSSDSKHR